MALSHPGRSVTAMSTQTSLEQTPSSPADYDPQRPYRDYPVIELVEWLEAQYSRGEYNDAVVWELAARACELEDLRQTAPPRA